MAARNMFIEIYEYPYKFMTFARMLGRPHGGAPTGLCRNSQKINSFKNRVRDTRHAKYHKAYDRLYDAAEQCAHYRRPVLYSDGETP